MKEFTYVINDELGIHARPAGLISKLAKDYGSKIMIGNGTKSVDASRLMGIMALGVKKGQQVTVTAEGDDEEAAIAAMEEFFKTEL